MAPSPLERKLARSLSYHLSDVAQQKSTEMPSGDKVLRRAAITRIFPLIGLGLASTALMMNALVDDDPHEKLMGYAITGPIAAFFLILLTVMWISRTVYNEEYLTTHRIFRRKELRLDDVTGISYTRMYAGCLVVQGRHGEKLLVPADSTGFLDFYEILKSRLNLTAGVIELEQRLLAKKKATATTTKQLLGIPEKDRSN